MKKLITILICLLIATIGCSSEEKTINEQEELTPPKLGSEPKQGEIYINQNKLTMLQISELEKIYNTKPIPGRYWYDSRSGSYGIWQGPSLGLILPNHEFGDLSKDASNGNSGVFINGRELPELDIQFLEWLFNAPRIPGRYWLDSNGNIGLEGDPTPLLNTYLAYSQHGQYSKSGDNYWASNFGAFGNEQNGFGYVMVDGVSVTYGG
jgi:uncharacterized protein YcfL